MAQDVPKRKFIPELVETTVRLNTSKRPEAVSHDGDETTSSTGKASSSLDSVDEPKTPSPVAQQDYPSTSNQNEEHRDGINLNEKAVSSTSPKAKKPRKFAIEPIEQSQRQIKKDEKKDDKKDEKKDGKKDEKKDEKKEATRIPRKFAVEPIEMSLKSSQSPEEKAGKKPKSRFAPQPVETTSRYHRKPNRMPSRRDSELDETPAELPKNIKYKPPPRKWSPQLIDTRSRRRNSSSGWVQMDDKFRTDVTPGHMIDASGEPIFTCAEFKRRMPRAYERRRERTGSPGSVRSHSFLAPDLETIDSSESDQCDSESPERVPKPAQLSVTTIPTSNTSTSSINPTKKAWPAPDKTFSQYLWTLKVRREEQRIRDQALAAFPNSDYHEPVEHYVDNDDNDSEVAALEDRPSTWEGHEDDEDLVKMKPQAWRQDTAKIDWDLVEMKKHHEALAKSKLDAQMSRGPSPWWNSPLPLPRGLVANIHSELQQMRRSARPPMLGAEIVFPRSQSPEPARFDITQGSEVLRNQVLNDDDAHSVSSTGLWANHTQPPSREDSIKGLWGGFCAIEKGDSPDDRLAQLASGLCTPAPAPTLPTSPVNELTDLVLEHASLRPPAPIRFGSAPLTCLGPLASSKEKTSLSPRVPQDVDSDSDIVSDEEDPDSFVTQVYNYLSLGYPSLARPFDNELSKITRIPISVLRQDDILAKASPKGYIRIGEDFQGRNDGHSQDFEPSKCARWRAMKLYIREWSRQEKSMVKVQTVPWGAAPRRGSWAF